MLWRGSCVLMLLCALVACRQSEDSTIVEEADSTAALQALVLRQLALLAELSEPLVAAAAAGDLDARLQLHEVDAQVLRAGLVPLRRAFGVRARALDEASATTLGLGAGCGAVLSEVFADGAAAAAGLRVGDCILRVDDEPLCFAGPTERAVQRGQVQVQVLRPGDQPALRTLPCELPKNASEPQVPNARAEAEAIMQRALKQVLREGGAVIVPVAPPSGDR